MVNRFKKTWIFIKTDLMQFSYYMITEPVIQLYQFSKMIIGVVPMINYPKTWLWVFTMLLVASFLAGNHYAGGVFLFLLLITIMKYEWVRGEWKRKHRERIIKRAKKMERKK